jgi:hypothetical protein
MDTKPVERSDESLNRTSPATPEAGGHAGSAKRTRRSATFTSTPDIPPPQLLCPTCDTALAYRQTVISGVKPIERWDYFDCRTCGPFVYRERTRKLRPTT